MNTLLVVASVVFAAIGCLIGFDVIHSEYVLGWLGLALATFFASEIVP